MVYVHPLLGIAAVAFLLFVASLGIRGRSRSRLRGRLLRRHAVMAPWALVAVLVTWLGGALSSHFLRRDLEFAESRHFLLGTCLVALLVSSLWTSRAMLRGNVTAREIHIWLGVAAVLIAAAQAFTGLGITP